MITDGVHFRYAMVPAGRWSRLKGTTPKGGDGPFDFGGNTGAYHEGDESTRFLSKEALLLAAEACWQKHYPEGKVLIEG